MKYEVIWTPQAESLLTQLWLSSRDHEAFREACESIDQQLAAEPLEAGEKRNEDRRILFADALASRLRCRRENGRSESCSSRGRGCGRVTDV